MICSVQWMLILTNILIMAVFPTEQTGQKYIKWCDVITCVSLNWFLGAAGNIACCGPVQTERANVIELFVIYKADYSSHNGYFW